VKLRGALVKHVCAGLAVVTGKYVHEIHYGTGL